MTNYFGRMTLMEWFVSDLRTAYDVMIACAGPVSQFLAYELRLAGVSVLVLEQSEYPHSPLKQFPFGMRGLSSPTIEAFYRRGMLDDISAPLVAEMKNREGNASTAAHWMNQTRRPGGHFAGIQFFKTRSILGGGNIVCQARLRPTWQAQWSMSKLC